MFIPSRITRYVLRELSTPTLLGLLLWTFFLMMNHFFVVAEKSLSKNLGWELTLRLFLTGVPNLLVLAIPMAVLLGSLIGVGRLSADHEWVALQSAGAGPWRLLRPLVIHGLMWSLSCFVIYAWIVPQSNYALRNLRGEVLFASNLASDLRPRVFYSDLPDVVLHVDDIRPGARERLRGVLLIETDRQSPTHNLILARSGDLYPDPDRSGDLILDLYDGVAHAYRLDSPESYQVARSFKYFQKRVEAAAYLKALLAPPDKVVQDFSPGELLAEVRTAREALARVAGEVAVGNASRGSDLLLARNRRDRATIELHQRLALPLASFFFALLALPLGLTRVRSGKGAGFALSLLVILVYWAAFTFARDQALRGQLPAMLGPWAGNLIVLPWAAFGLWRLRRPPSERRGPLAWLASLLARLVNVLRARSIRRHAPALLATSEEGRAEAELTELGGTSTRFVGRLDQYVGAQYLRLLLFSVAATYLVYGLVETKNLLDGALRSQQPLSLILAYFKYFPPGVLRMVLPISCLVAAVITFTLLSRTGEVTAMKAVGISMRRATVSVVALTLLFSAMLFLVQDRIAPASNRKAQAIKDRILGRGPRTYGPSLNGRWAFGPGGQRLYHARIYDPDREEFQGLRVFTLERSEPRIVDHRFSERARWSEDGWELERGWYRSFSRETVEVYEINDDVIHLPLDPPEYFAGRQPRLTSRSKLPEQLSLSELDVQIDALEDSGYDITQLRVAYHGKMAHAVTPLVMVLLGLPFAFRVGRRGSLYGIGVALILVLVYWATFAIFNALGLETLLEPWVAAWAPNILFSLLGVYLMLYIRT
jgi:LPS export ABC transporter permease LptG/LPS export ABC transporter permease LptF